MPTDPTFWFEVLVETITLSAMIVGLLGLVVPVFPGLIIIWLSALAYALIENSIGKMGWIDWTLFAFITLLAAFGSVVDNIIIARKMLDKQIPWRSILLSYAAGIIISLFATPIVGILAAPAALVGAEYLRLKDWRAALTSAKTYMIAWGWSFGAVFGVGALMVGLWMLWAWL
jgi:uncharacterized protein YqgC (DUF456 family)